MVGNKIYSNTIDGIYISKVSIGIIADNDIYSNGQNGIFVTQNSGVNLGMNTGSATFDHSNISTAPNLGKGLKCSIGGYADGILGTLTGAGRRDATDFTRDCINNLIP
jgi:parallel beta-helix repeat protein